MRDKIKNKDYFNCNIELHSNLIQRGLNLLKGGKVVETQIPRFKKGIFDNYFFILICSYSIGHDKETIKRNLLNAIDYLKDSWSSEIVLLNNQGKIYNQYAENYDEMLWMLSLGYLLNIDEKDFKKLVDVIDRDNVKDFLFEFIIRAKLKDREIIVEESYQVFFGIPNVFEKLRQAINESNKKNAEKLAKDFITKDWYKKHKDSGWYNSHKSKHDSYFGYWSFETAAIVKIMNLNDSEFGDNQYYPKDLI
ncbi:PoNe immunity protein domain-containing protein [Emticicia sp. SJ17W-69]|uniref:PoNe immunity protein domain-containing protein n=1 Tax=Emticicia sp. SJ17W-69 TaxID=3421657 RepID=UPI003EB9DCC1